MRLQKLSRIYRVPLWQRPAPRYPVYIKGGPQNRVFLCQFWMRVLKPYREIPPNHVHFEIHPQMTHHDIRQYLQKIYNIPVLTIKTEIISGEREYGSPSKTRDKRIAFVQLDGQEFIYPSVPVKEVDEESIANMGKERKDKEISVNTSISAQRQQLPSWFR